MIEKIKEICNCNDEVANKVLEVMLNCHEKCSFVFRSKLVYRDKLGRFITVSKEDIEFFLKGNLSLSESCDDFFSEKTLSFFYEQKKSNIKEEMIIRLIREVFYSLDYYSLVLSRNIHMLYKWGYGMDYFDSPYYTSNLERYRKMRGDGYEFLKEILIKFIGEECKNYSQHKIDELLKGHFFNFKKEFLKAHPESVKLKDLAGNTINLFIIDRLTTKEISKEVEIGNISSIKKLLISELESFVKFAFKDFYNSISQKKKKMKVDIELIYKLDFADSWELYKIKELGGYYYLKRILSQCIDERFEILSDSEIDELIDENEILFNESFKKTHPTSYVWKDYAGKMLRLFYIENLNPYDIRKKFGCLDPSTTSKIINQEVRSFINLALDKYSDKL